MNNWTRMWANAQRHGRPAEHSWLMLTTWLPCSNDAKKQNPLKLAGVPQTPEPISAISGLKFTILCGTSGGHIAA